MSMDRFLDNSKDEIRSSLIKQAMFSDIIDNRIEENKGKKTLTGFLKEILEKASAGDFATGYLYLSGLSEIIEQLEQLDSVRILTDNVMKRKNAEEIIALYSDKEHASKTIRTYYFPSTDEKQAIRKDLRNMFKTQLEHEKQTDEEEALIKRLRAMVKNGKLKIRLYTKGRLHAKAYITYFKEPILGNDGIAIVGSSNLTLSGLKNNTELNAVIKSGASVGAVAKWFQNLWEDSEDFSEDLLKILDESWALNEVRPYDLYLKAIIEAISGRFEETMDEEVFWETVIQGRLTRYQESAVKQAIKIIDEYQGVIIGDVVGLGKTYIGLALLKYFYAVRNERSLVICPPALKDMWTELLLSFQIPAKVISHAELSKGYEKSGLANDYIYGDVSVVLIDESHNFRNRDTNRYKTLDQFLLEGKSGRKTIMLTATPRNNTIWDIFNQIRLFLGETTTQLPIDPPNLKEYFKLIEEEEEKRRLNPKGVVGTSRIVELLRQIMIRRTRKHVLEHYGKKDEKGRKYIPLGEQRLYFPERELETVSYNIDVVYSKQNNESLYNEILGIISELSFARYDLGNYLLEDYKNKRPYTELGTAGSNLRGIIRTLLLKRFESSVIAFKKTVDRLIQLNEAFLKGLSQNMIIAGKIGTKNSRELLLNFDDIDFTNLEEEISIKYETKAFNLAKLREAISSDISLLKEIRSAVESLDETNDDKLHVLLNHLIGENLFSINNIRNNSGLKWGGSKIQKTIVFTQFADTAEYLYTVINYWLPNIKVALITSKTPNKLSIIRRFSPKSNNAIGLVTPDEEIDVLISTDVLSEGLNLQDAKRVINYDLHWNPVRLIQRIGRIDRLGSENEKIYILNFLPEERLERVLGLKERIRRRIDEIHRTIGEDAKILEKDEQLNEQAMYAIYEKDASILDQENFSDSEIGVEFSSLETLIEKIKQENPEYYNYLKELPLGIRSCSSHEKDETIVLCKAGNYFQFYSVNNDGVSELSLWDGFQKLKCPEETRPMLLPQKHNTRVIKALDKFKEKVKLRKHEKEAIYQSPNRRYVIDELIKYSRKLKDGDQRKDSLAEIIKVIKFLPSTLEQTLRRMKQNKLTGEEIFNEMRNLLLRLGLKVKDLQPKEEELEIPLIVCSLST